MDQQAGRLTDGTDFLAGGGEMGASMRRHDWSASPLGHPATWPQSLRSVVGLLLESKLPMFVAWGPELAFLYNDPYAEILGAKHPAALGRRFRDVWAEIWPDIAPLTDAAMAGRATYRENLPLVVNRKGFDEQTWFTFSYSPVRDEGGAVAGMFCACTETTERVLAERLLRESEENYRHASDLSPQTAWTARPDGQLDHVGARWREWTGTSGLGSSWGDAMHPDDLARSVEAWTRSVATGEPYDVRHRARSRDGSYRWVHSRAYPRRDGAGAIVRWYGTTEDVHAARTAEEALRESEARFRNMADHAPVMMWVTDADARCSYLNRAWYAFTGQTEAEAEGFGWLDATHPDDRAGAEKVFLEANACRAPFRLEYRLRRADGAYRWAIDAAAPRFGPDGAFLGYVGSVIDIDERREAEDALREAGDRLRLATEAADVGTWDFDPVTGALRWDARCKELFGLAPSAAADYDTFLAGLHPDDREATDAAVRGALAPDGPGGYDVEYRTIGLEDGVERWIAAKGRAFFEGSGPARRATRFAGTVVDISERKAATEALRASEERYRALAEAIGTVVWATRADGSAEDVPRWRALTGQAPEEVRGFGWLDAVHPDDREATARAWAAAVERREPLDVECRVRGADGVHRWYNARGVPVPGPDGAVREWVGVCIDVNERREAEGRVRESEARLRGVLEGMAEGFALLDRDFRILEMNAEGLRLDNRSRGSVVGKTHWEAYPGSEERELGRLYKKAMAERVPVGLEHRHVWEDGRAAWLETRAYPADGGLAVFYRDITGRRQAEARRLALVELGDRIRDVDDPAELSFAAAEILGRALGVSRAGYGTIDTAAETVTIERDWNAPGVGSLAGVLRFRDYGSYIEDLKRGETVVFADAEKDPRTAATAGALKAIGAQAVVNMPVTEQGGFVALLYLNHATAREWPPEELAFVREVAERTRTAVARRRAEAELRELNDTLERRVAERTRELAASEARFHAYFDASPEHLFLARVAPAGGMVFQDVNPAAASLYGLARAEIVGRAPAEILEPATAADVERRARECLRLGRPLRYEAERRFASGRALVLDVVAAPLPTPEGGDSLVLFCGRDLTEQRQAEEQLRQSQKMEAVGQLTGGIAHDFNNLLTGITGSLEMLSARLSQGRVLEADRYVTAAQGAAKRAAALTHRLLAFSRRQTLDPKPVDLNRLVAGMEDLVRRTVGPGVAVEVVAAGGLWTTLADPNQLENALLNLCINARDAMPDGGKLTIETANRWLDARAGAERDLPPGQYVSLCVTDTGTGMTPDVARRAFDPFFTTKPIGMGTGLGLSMIYGFVRQSGGQARIYSEPGHGAMVCLYLPRHVGAEEEADGGGAEPAAEALPRAARGETVLVVDDEPTVRMLIGEVLEELGYNALEAADGPSGLKALRSAARIDLLVTDVGLPGGMNGRQLADAARQARPGLKVLFITGYAENAVLNHGHLERGMHVLTKPFSMEALASRIKDLAAGT